MLTVFAAFVAVFAITSPVVAKSSIYTVKGGSATFKPNSAAINALPASGITLPTGATGAISGPFAITKGATLNTAKGTGSGKLASGQSFTVTIGTTPYTFGNFSFAIGKRKAYVIGTITGQGSFKLFDVGGAKLQKTRGTYKYTYAGRHPNSGGTITFDPQLVGFVNAALAGKGFTPLSPDTKLGTSVTKFK